MSGEIVVVGSSNVDFVMVVEHLPRRGESVPSARFGQLFGGKGANQAVAAARAGARVAFAGCMGDDVFGKMMIGNLSEAGIAVDRVAVRTGVASGAALIMVDQQGGNILSVAPGANHFVSPEFVRSLEPAISGAAFVLLQNEIPRESVEAAIDLAHALGTPVMLNLAPAGPIDEARLGKLSYLVVNETEAESLCGFAVEGQTGVEAAADWILARGARTAIITLGAAGAYLAGQGFRELAPAFSVAAVDTTAAGDVYCGAIAAALVEGRPLPEAARFATAASAICVTRLGAQASIPERAEIEAFLAQA